MASVSITKWKVQANQITLITGASMNSLGAGAGVAGSATTNVQGDSDRDGYTKAEVELLLAAPPAAWKDGAALDLYFLRGNDGTNYETYDTATPPKRAPDATFFPAASAAAQRLYGVNPKDQTLLVDMPVGGFTPFLFSRAGNGTSTASSGNTLKAELRTPEEAT